jgi:Tfp pilus assembly protein FimT
MRRRSAFTLIEMVLCVALTAIVIGVMATLYGFAAVRLSDAYTKTSLYDQMNSVADRIESTIKNARTCSLDVSGNLKCNMPVNGIDSDGDGYFDTYYPDSTDANGMGHYSAGNTVWFYDAGSNAAYGTGSNYVWRAEVPGLTAPTSLNLDHSFGYYYNGNIRYPLVTSTTFVVSPATQTVTFTVTGSVRIGSENFVTTSEDNTNRVITLTRTVCWRNSN